MIELRCDTHFHAQFDPVHMRILVKCRHCSKRQGREVRHEWPLHEIAEQYRAGDIIPICHPNKPTFVRWIVTSAE